MKVLNYVFGVTAGLLLTGCGGGKITDINDQKVFFAYDSSEISRGAKDDLLAQSEYLKENKDIKVQIAGNCDERGTREYNLALGARRANAAKSVLVKDGVGAGRIKTISYGKDRPAVNGSGESVWKQNRNATTTVAK
ncbi:MAG: peptidoglycan-associated lipoprotein Pal [Rickettsiales bacterium]|jgi:peptidoglycan-associated lipoprotein|nr:peptidoglycan-associated lipoprotein Pal [Rickettsiales bacterium]